MTHTRGLTTGKVMIGNATKQHFCDPKTSYPMPSIDDLQLERTID